MKALDLIKVKNPLKGCDSPSCVKAGCIERQMWNEGALAAMRALETWLEDDCQKKGFSPLARIPRWQCKNCRDELKAGLAEGLEE